MRTFIFTFICFLIVSIGKAEEARLIRFPHINGKQIVFSYAGDLYTVSDQGGTARKLTSDIGYEMFPRISPDGKYIAFRLPNYTKILKAMRTKPIFTLAGMKEIVGVSIAAILETAQL